jgi:hypothetical protein
LFFLQSKVVSLAFNPPTWPVAVANCYWGPPAKSFSVPSPADLITILYCLKPLWALTAPCLCIYVLQWQGGIGAWIILSQWPSLSAHEWVYATYFSRLQRKTRERERNKRAAHGRRTQCINSDPVTSTSELLQRQNSVTAHAHHSSARRLVPDHCAIEIHRSKSAVRPIQLYPQAPGYLCIALHGWQVCGGGIPTRLHAVALCTRADGNFWSVQCSLRPGRERNVVLEISVFPSTDTVQPCAISNQLCESAKVSGLCSRDDCRVQWRKMMNVGRYSHDRPLQLTAVIVCISLPCNRVTTKAHNLPSSVDMQSWVLGALISKQTNPVAWARERIYRPSDHRLSAKLVPTFTDRGCHVISVTDPYYRILGFLDRARINAFPINVFRKDSFLLW